MTMRFVQVSGYLNGGFTGYRRTYFTESQADALDQFRKDYSYFPTIDNWICIAEYVEVDV